MKKTSDKKKSDRKTPVKKKSGKETSIIEFDIPERKNGAGKYQEHRKQETKNSEKENGTEVKVVMLTAVIAATVLGFMKSGTAGSLIRYVMLLLFGNFWPLVSLVTAFYIASGLFGKRKKLSLPGYVMSVFALSAFTVFNKGETAEWCANLFIEKIKSGNVEGYQGFVSSLLNVICIELFGFGCGKVILAVIVILGVYLMLPDVKRKKNERLPVQKKTVQESKKKGLSEKVCVTDIRHISVKPEHVAEPHIKEKKKPSSVPEKKEIRKLENGYVFPPLKLLDDPAGKDSVQLNRKTAAMKGEKIISILKTFGIGASLSDIHIGPSVTKFEIRPEKDIKVSRIQNISDNIKMELEAKEIRIEAPIPGKNTVGIEIPNAEAVPVKMKELVSDMPSSCMNSPLVFGLGKNLFGECVFCNLEKMPHLLIAGSTGSGKSVCINTIITSYIMKSSPEELKLVLVDPKKVEFTPYHDIPHLMWPVITDAKIASLMLQRIVAVMEERYSAMSATGVRNLSGYNEYVEKYNRSLKKDETPMKKLCRIVVIIDELADLMLVAGKEVESSIQRITQLARAAGIHLIVATQRPSTDVITGLIKSNIPSRISFAVSSSIDSRTIIDQTGAEKLLGNGDMLYLPQGENSPVRLQGCYVSDREIEAVAGWAKEQAKPDYDDAYFQIQNNMNASQTGGFSFNEEDTLYEDVVEFVKEAQKASTSLLQRRFGIGYNRAARLIDTLEERGVIGPGNGSKPRDVYIAKD